MENFKCFFHQKTWRFIASFWLLLCCSQAANALDYYWSTAQTGTRYNSADSVCSALYDVSAPSPLYQKLSYSVQRNTDVSAVCKLIYEMKPENVPRYGYSQAPVNINVFRFGDSCPSGTTWNSQALKCDAPEPDKCESSKGQVVYHAQKIADIQDGHLANYAEPPASVCGGSCGYSSPAEFADAYRFKNGDPAGVWQNYSYIGTGTSCTASTSMPEPSTPSERIPTSSKTNQCTNKVTDAEGRVHYTCVSSDSSTDPGNLKCAVGESGKKVCVSGSPSPGKKDTQTKTDVTETKASDGSSTTSTTTTTTVTSCSGVNSCSTTTTVNNSSTTTKADGTQGDSSSSCSGAGCKTGTGDTPTDQQDPEKDKKEVAGDGQCDLSLLCSGDAIQCAILRQEKAQKCADEDFRKVDDKKVADTKAGIEGAFTGDEYSPIKPNSDGILDVSSMIDTGRHFSSTCPVVPDITFSWIDGSSQSIKLADFISQFCQVLVWMGYFVVAFAWRGAAEIIARGIS